MSWPRRCGGPAPPPSARVTVQNYVKRLRQALADAGRDQDPHRSPADT